MTETTQPDPRVVAWMRARMSEEPHGLTTAAVRECREATGLSDEDMRAAVDAALKPKPLTVADIPAGQGPASLYIGRPESFRRTGLAEFALLFKRAGGSSEVVDWPPEGQSPGSAALWDHLVATLPTVTT